MRDLNKVISEGLDRRFKDGKEIALLEAKMKILRLSADKKNDNLDVYEIIDLLDAMIAHIKNNA